MKPSAVLIAALLGVAGAGAADAATIYTAGFETGLDGFSTTGARRTDNGESYIGDLTLGATASRTFNVAGYTNIKLSFDLYAVLSLDGNGQGTGDPFNLAINGVSTYTRTFANYGNNTQSYGGPNTPAGDYARHTGATGTGHLGLGDGDFGDAEYSFSGSGSFAVTPVGDLLTVTFTGNSNQSSDDEFYGIDNVTITGDRVVAGAAPEPAAWMLMLGGFGAAGSALRRRRPLAKVAGLA